MSDAIKSISLDDVVGLQGQGKEQTVVYNPQQAVAFNPFQTTSPATGMEQPTDQRRFRFGSTEDSSGTVLSRLTAIMKRFDGSPNMRNFIKVGVVLLVLMAIFILAGGDGWLSQLFSQFGSSDQVEVPADNLAHEDAPPQAAMPQAPLPPAGKQMDLQNPYWSLPNPLDVKPAPGGMLNPGQEERWRQGLAHPFIWQRYKTVMEVRAAGFGGSQQLLHDALAQPKLWTRMEALFALAESGEAPDIDTVEAALGSTRRFLLQNYFRRFRLKATEAEIHIMRQAVRVVDAGTRRVILENLSNRRDEINELYLVAATYDPNVKVSSWINQFLVGRPLSQAARVRFQQIAAGLDVPADSAPASADPVPAPAAPVPNGKVQDLDVEELPHDSVNVEEVYFLKDEGKVEKKATPVDDGFQDIEAKP